MNNLYYENEAVWFCCLRLFASFNFSIAFGLEDPKIRRPPRSNDQLCFVNVLVKK